MDVNKTTYKYDDNCHILTIPDFTTADAYTVAATIDTSKHPSFALQLINKHATAVLSYKIDTTFDGVTWSVVKAEADIAGTANAIYEDESIGTKTIISVKSKVGSTPATLSLWCRLKPASFIV